MKPPPFEYVRVETVEEAIRVVGESGDEAKLLAGGQSLVPMLNLRLARPATLVDINRLPLDGIEEFDGALRIGALVRQHRLIDDERIADNLPLLADAARFIAHPAIRNRGTVGGSISHADPTAELPLVAVANDATMIVAGTSGDRKIKAADFFQGAFTTSLADDELLRAIEFRILGEEVTYGFAEVAEREGDFAIAAAAVQLAWRGETISDAAVAVCGGSELPMRLRSVEDVALDSTSDAISRLSQQMGVAVTESVQPIGDVHASAEYRRHLIAEMVSRSVRQAVERRSP